MEKFEYDRFIPCRSGMNMDVSRTLLRTSSSSSRSNGRGEELSASYQRLLVEGLLENRTHILAFNNKIPKPTNFLSDAPVGMAKSVKPRFRKIPQNPIRILSAPYLNNDYYLNLLDWSSQNLIALALDNSVLYWNALSDGGRHRGSHVRSVDFGVPFAPVTSVSWSPNGRLLAIGLSNSTVEVWDTESCRAVEYIQGTHRHGYRVGALCWQNDDILTTGGEDGRIVNNDLRMSSTVVQKYRGHTGEICGLKWDGLGRKLASGGNDDLLHIWDVSMASLSSSHNNVRNQSQWLHRFEDHKAAVKALAWCPYQRNMLASGGGTGDQSIKFWNTQAGTCMKSIDTGSQICALIWNKHEMELLSSHGYQDNQMIVWKYPSMDKMAELKGHTSRVLSMAVSPDGCTVASTAADETLRFWKVFVKSSGLSRHVQLCTSGMFSSSSHISLTYSVGFSEKIFMDIEKEWMTSTEGMVYRKSKQLSGFSEKIFMDIEKEWMTSTEGMVYRKSKQLSGTSINISVP